MNIGPRVKARRNALNLTLADLSERSGVSRAMLCDIEAGKKNPSIRIVFEIARGLECSLSELLGLPEASPEIAVQRKDERQVLVDASCGIERHLLSPTLISQGVQVILYRAPAGSTLEPIPPQPAGVMEHATMLRGGGVLSIGRRDVELGEGDSVTYPASAPRGFANTSELDSEVLLVVVSPQGVSPA